MKVVQSAANFSEGYDERVVSAIVDAARGVRAVDVADVHVSPAAHRFVLTVLGPPDAVLDAVYRAAAVAVDRIDMSRHEGQHPRLGAVDVVPFIPVRDVTMDECVELARRFGQRVGGELGVPVYLYDEAQPVPERKSLASIRKGGYGRLAERLADPDWRPDFGPARFISRSGATVTGARFFLIAYNVNVLGDRDAAHEIALVVRERGGWRTRGDGTRSREPGRFRAVEALGWSLEEPGLSQVSMNLRDYRVSPMHEVFEAIRGAAGERGLAVVGSELVGLTPLEPILMAGDHYASREGLYELREAQRVRLAVDRLGLSSLHLFEPAERIIEYRLSPPRSGAG